MARKIVIVSGKGGVGKTTITANLGLKLAENGSRVMLIDADLDLNNLDVVTEVEDLVVFDIVDVLSGKCRVKQALIQSPLSKNLFIMPCSRQIKMADDSVVNLNGVVNEVDILFDFILIDAPAGIDAGFLRAISCATEAIVVLTPTITSVRDADKVIAILKSYKIAPIKIIVNKMRGDLVLSGDMFSTDEIEQTLKVEVLGVIPEEDVLKKGLYQAGSESLKAFSLTARALKLNKGKTYDYLKRYSGFLGSIRRELKKRL